MKMSSETVPKSNLENYRNICKINTFNIHTVQSETLHDKSR